MFKTLALVALIVALFIPTAQADELTQIIQNDLVALGYDPGNTEGEKTMETVVAISKFQAENGLEVTGEPSPQLAGIIKSKSSPQLAASAAPAQPDPAMLQAAQQACLQEKRLRRRKHRRRRNVASAVS